MKFFTYFQGKPKRVIVRYLLPKVWSKPVVVGYQPLFRQEVPYCQTRSIVTVLYHHKRITIMVLYEQVQEQEEKKCVKAM